MNGIGAPTAQLAPASRTDRERRTLVVCRTAEAAGSAWRYERPRDLKVVSHPPWEWLHADGSVTRFVGVGALQLMRGTRWDAVEWRAPATDAQRAFVRAELLRMGDA